MHTVFLHELHGFSKYYHYRSRNTENGRRNCYESNRNRAPDRRPRPRGHPQGDPPHHAYPRGRPVTDDIDAVGEILLCYAGFVKKMGAGLYIVTEDEGKSVGIRKEKIEAARRPMVISDHRAVPHY